MPAAIAVFDSGAWISALSFGSVPTLALEWAFAEDQIAICDQIVVEVRRVLSERLGWEADRVVESLGIYLRDAIRGPVRGAVRDVRRDSKDDTVFEAVPVEETPAEGARSSEPKRSGNSVRYFKVLNRPSESGLSSET